MILRVSSDDGAVADHVIFAHLHRTADDGVRLDDAAGADDGGAFHQGVGAYFHTFPDGGFRTDNGCAMNLQLYENLKVDRQDRVPKQAHDRGVYLMSNAMQSLPPFPTLPCVTS